MPEIRLAFKAGRAFRRDGTSFVDPNPTKGAVILQNGDDDLLHFQWKNRVTNEIEEVRRTCYWSDNKALDPRARRT